MGDITNNISRHEVACRCGCGYDSSDYWTAKFVQFACDYFSATLQKKVILDIHSGCRCHFWNKHEGGSKASLHMWARAIDHSIRGVTPERLYWYYCVTYPGKFGVILYDGFVHFDTRSGQPYRDDRRADKSKPIPWT